MDYPIIAKPPVASFRVRPHLDDYDAIRNGFQYPDVINELDGLPGGGLNIAYEAIDRHVAHGNGERLCWIWEGKNGDIERYTYGDAMRNAGNHVETVVLREPELLFKPGFFKVLPAIHERQPLGFGVAYPHVLGRGGIIGVFKQVQEPG